MVIILIIITLVGSAIIGWNNTGLLPLFWGLILGIYLIFKLCKISNKLDELESKIEAIQNKADLLNDKKD